MLLLVHIRETVRIVIKSLAYVTCPVLNDSDTAQVVLDHVEDLVAARAGQQTSSLPASALEGDRAVRGLVEHDVAEVETGRRSVADLRQRSVGKVAPLG